MKQTTN